MTTSDKLKQIFQQVLNVDTASVGDHSSTRTIGTWDSMRHVDLILEIEDQFDVKFEATEVFGLASYTNILAVLEEKLAAAS